MAKPFCSLPWSGVHINQQLDVFFCCLMANPENTLGNLREQPLTDILNSEDAREVRQGFLDGVVPSRCDACKFRTGDIIIDLTESERLDIFVRQELAHITLHAADIRSSNLCTLDCVYCGPIWSSSIAKRDGHYTLIPSAENQRQYQQYINDIDLSNIRRLFLAGGEPLLMKEYIKLLEHVLKYNPNCSITVNTGLSVVNTPVFDLLTQLPNVTWILSVDTTDPDKFAYIRHGHTWDNFTNNLQKIKNIPGHILVAHMVYFALSYKNFDVSYSTLKSLGIGPVIIDPVSHHALDLRNVPQVLDQVKLDIERYKLAGIFSNEVYNSIAGKFNLPHTSPETIHAYLAKMDSKYNMNSRKIFPELYNG
jgi:sulfatase maturation enzyme AslB (radical SAM superfamily)